MVPLFFFFCLLFLFTFSVNLDSLILEIYTGKRRKAKKLKETNQARRASSGLKLSDSHWSHLLRVMSPRDTPTMGPLNPQNPRKQGDYQQPILNIRKQRLRLKTIANDPSCGARRTVLLTTTLQSHYRGWCLHLVTPHHILA